MQKFHFKQAKQCTLGSILLFKGEPVWPVKIIKLISFGTYKIQRINFNNFQYANSHDLYEWNQSYQSQYSSINNRKLTLAMKKAIKQKQKQQIALQENGGKIQSQFDNIQKNQDNLEIKEEEEEDQDVDKKSMIENNEAVKLNFIKKLSSISIQSLFDDLKKGNTTKMIFYDSQFGEKKENTFRPKFLILAKLQYCIQDLIHLFLSEENIPNQLLSNIKKIMSSDLITPLDYVYTKILRYIYNFEKMLQQIQKKKIGSKVKSCLKYLQDQRQIIKCALITYLSNYSVQLQVQKDIAQINSHEL